MKRNDVLLMAVAWAGLIVGAAAWAHAPVIDESVFVDGLRANERERVLYIWTRDADGEESDFLSVVDVDPESPTYGTIISRAETGSSGNEAHHFGYTRDAQRIFGGGLFSNRLFIYDVRTDARRPRLVRTVNLDVTGYSGPHTLYAVPDGMLIAMLGQLDGDGPSGIIKVDDEGRFVEAYPAQAGHDGAPIYMYDLGVKPEMNLMVSSSWAHPDHARLPGGVPSEHTGSEVVVWDWTTKRIRQVETLDRAPLEVRWLHGPGAEASGGFINCASGGTVWYWEDADGDGSLEFYRVLRLERGAVPADLRISYDNRFLYVTLWGQDRVQQYDISDRRRPRLVSEVSVPQPNMMKLSPDSKRLYVTNSMLSTVDGEVEFGVWLIHTGPDGMRLDAAFSPDFMGLPTGPAGPHDMLLK